MSHRPPQKKKAQQKFAGQKVSKVCTALRDNIMCFQAEGQKSLTRQLPHYLLGISPSVEINRKLKFLSNAETAMTSMHLHPAGRRGAQIKPLIGVNRYLWAGRVKSCQKSCTLVMSPPM
jgi:hypothetical protein